MPRTSRNAPGGGIYHVLNRAVARLPLFGKASDYAAFEQVLSEAHHRIPIRILAYTVMPNHWHFVVWPQQDDELTSFMRWLTHTHTMRWHACHRTGGTGHLYQGRFKSFPVQDDEHLYAVLRYVERNPLRSKLVSRAEDWRWGSLWRRTFGSMAARSILTPWPLACPPEWLAFVNQAQHESEVSALRGCISRGTPWGDEAWKQAAAERLGLESTLRTRGRPRKEKGDAALFRPPQFEGF